MRAHRACATDRNLQESAGAIKARCIATCLSQVQRAASGVHVHDCAGSCAGLCGWHRPRCSPRRGASECFLLNLAAKRTVQMRARRRASVQPFAGRCVVGKVWLSATPRRNADICLGACSSTCDGSDLVFAIVWSLPPPLPLALPLPLLQAMLQLPVLPLLPSLPLPQFRAGCGMPARRSCPAGKAYPASSLH